jgi:hypothetical protein
MRKALAACLASTLLSAAAPAAPQSPAQSPERPAATGEAGKNLKLEEAAKAPPRITYDPRDLAGMATEQSPGGAADGLPSLGGSSSRSFDAGGRGKVPYPKDMNSGQR